MARVVHEYVGKPKPAKRQRIEDQFAASKTRALDVRSQLLELQLEERLGNLIERELVLRQLSYVLTHFKQRALSVPTAWSRRLLGIDDARQMSEALREMVTGLLIDLADLPQRITDPDFDPDAATNGANGKTLAQVFAEEKTGDAIDIVW